MLKIKSKIIKKKFQHRTLNKLEEGATHLIGCETYFYAQRLHPHVRKILDTWGLGFLALIFSTCRQGLTQIKLKIVLN